MQQPDKSRAKSPITLGQAIQVSVSNLRLDKIVVEKHDIAAAVVKLKKKKL